MRTIVARVALVVSTGAIFAAALISGPVAPAHASISKLDCSKRGSLGISVTSSGIISAYITRTDDSGLNTSISVANFASYRARKKDRILASGDNWAAGRIAPTKENGQTTAILVVNNDTAGGSDTITADIISSDGEEYTQTCYVPTAQPSPTTTTTVAPKAKAKAKPATTATVAPKEKVPTPTTAPKKSKSGKAKRSA